jgi:cleavage and polyadenylation specificity factor subunit 1
MSHCVQVFLRSGQLTIYEVHASNPTDLPPPGARPSSLLIKFVKVLSQAFDIQRSPEPEKGIGILSEQKRISHLLIPFVTSPTPGTTLSGVFFTGDRPSWILATNKTGIRIHPSGMAVVHAFTTCSLWDNKGDFLLYSDEVSFSCQGPGPLLKRMLLGTQST